MHRSAFLLPLVLVACSGSTTPDLTSSSSSSSSSGGSSSGSTGPETAPQSAFTGEMIGCANVNAYRSTPDRTQFVTVVLDRASLGLAVGSKATYDLARAPSGVQVGIDVWSAAPTSEKYCTDFGTNDGATRTQWEAEAGSITIELKNDPSAAPSSGSYLATIKITNAQFIGPKKGVAAFVPQIVIENVRVGWLPG
jgi:hypothetical protein